MTSVGRKELPSKVEALPPPRAPGHDLDRRDHGRCPGRSCGRGRAGWKKRAVPDSEADLPWSASWPESQAAVVGPPARVRAAPPVAGAARMGWRRLISGRRWPRQAAAPRGHHADSPAHHRSPRFAASACDQPNRHSPGGTSGRGRCRRTGWAPPADRVTGDVNRDFHHQLRIDERDLQDVTAAPPRGERAPRPRMLAQPTSALLRARPSRNGRARSSGRCSAALPRRRNSRAAACPVRQHGQSGVPGAAAWPEWCSRQLRIRLSPSPCPSGYKGSVSSSGTSGWPRRTCSMERGSWKGSRPPAWVWPKRTSRRASSLVP